MKKFSWPAVAGLVILLSIEAIAGFVQAGEKETVIDMKVKEFLGKMRNQWHDWNVPAEDGKILYEIITQNGFARALEVGTSTGHSAIWIAWALSKTGGRLITLEIDEGRYRQAKANFKAAGLDAYIDARLADAQRLVSELPGPFDFIFIDADKEGYPHYAKALSSKISPGGCMTAHNVVEPGPVSPGSYENGAGEYYRYMRSLPGFTTWIHPQSRYGIAISCRMK